MCNFFLIFASVMLYFQINTKAYADTIITNKDYVLVSRTCDDGSNVVNKNLVDERLKIRFFENGELSIGLIGHDSPKKSVIKYRVDGNKIIANFKRSDGQDLPQLISSIAYVKGSTLTLTSELPEDLEARKAICKTGTAVITNFALVE